MVEISVDTPKEVTERLMQLASDFPETVANAIWMELSKVLNESKKICPVDTGALRGSGYVPEPYVAPGIIRAEIGYSQGYAWWVHELIENYHKPPTQAKYLEQPLTEALPTITDKIVERTVWLLEHGGGTEALEENAP